MTSTKIHVIRHDEVDNPKDILYGHLPGYGLTPLGHEMAQRGADSLRGQGTDITAIVSSPLLRTQLTTVPTASAYDLPIISNPRPIGAGSNFEGLSVNVNRSLLLRLSTWKSYLRPLEPSWGEPYVGIARRMQAAVSGAFRAAKGHGALIVSYQSPITILTRSARKQPLIHVPWSRQCSLASITSFEFEDATLIRISYAEPNADLLEYTQDMTPGNSAAALKHQGLGAQG